MDEKVSSPTTHHQEEVGRDFNGTAAPKKKGVMNTLYPPGPKPGAGGRIKNHCRRFWWCDLLVIAVIALVIVLPIIYVAIPKKAQKDINASTLEVTAQDVTNPTPDGIHLKLVSVARSFSKFHPTIEKFDATLALEGQAPFLTIHVPQVKSEAKTDIVVEHDVTITNKDAFSKYTIETMEQENFFVYMSGKTKVRQPGLQPIPVNYNKKIPMKGLNKLSGLDITDLKILSGQGSVLEDGSNLIGNVHIPNPSFFTLDLGNITMNLAIDGTAIGTSLLPNMVLKPGNNTFAMQSKVSQLEVLQLVRSKYNNGIVPLEITGNSSVYNGQHLEYFEAAIRSNTVKLDLNLGPALKEIGINVTSS